MIDEILWSPDGAHIAVMNGSRLYIMDADGSNVRVVGDEFDPMDVAWSAWSPDGTRLAFAEASQPDEEIRIRVAPMDGAAPAEVGSLPLAGCAYNLECGLTWSPTGPRSRSGSSRARSPCSTLTERARSGPSTS